MPELPYFPFYGSDWLGDSMVRRMPLEARGVYIDLLCHAWDAGCIPSDRDEIAHMLGIQRRKLDSLWSSIEPWWKSDGNGGLINPRQERERAKQKAKRKAGASRTNSEQS